MINLSHPETALVASPGRRQRVQQADEVVRRSLATIETALEFGTEAMAVLGEGKRVIRPADGGLQVAEQRVDGRDLRQLGALLAAAGRDPFVVGGDVGGGAEARRTVRDGRGRRREVLGGEHGYPLGGMRLLPVAGDDGLAFPGGFSSAHRLHDLVLHQPGGPVAQAELALECQGGNVVLGLGEKLQGRKPPGQWQLGGGANVGSLLATVPRG